MENYLQENQHASVQVIFWSFGRDGTEAFQRRRQWLLYGGGLSSVKGLGHVLQTDWVGFQMYMHRYMNVQCSTLNPRYLGGVLLEGGSESSASLLQSLILCLITFPNVLKKVQDEVDSVIGEGFSSVDDIPSLPCIQAILKEVSLNMKLQCQEQYMIFFVLEINRFRPPGPSAIPHTMLSTQEASFLLHCLMYEY